LNLKAMEERKGKMFKHKMVPSQVYRMMPFSSHFKLRFVQLRLLLILKEGIFCNLKVIKKLKFRIRTKLIALNVIL
jgi:hypothetical protein